MAHFCNHKGERITEVTLPNSMNSGAKSVTIGLWGFLDFQGKELQILAPPYISVKRGAITGKVRLYELSSYHPGTWTIEAITVTGSSWDKLSVLVKNRESENSAPAAKGGKYTDNPNEVVTQSTKPTAPDVVTMLLQAWPELTETGARTLTAQFMAETGGGKYCFNWNLGNVKSGPNDPHMYLRGVWEVDSPAGAQAQAAKANGLARLAAADEIKKKGWSCPPGKAVVVFEPPHPQCRFRAYSSLRDGAGKWLGHHKKIAAGNPKLLTALNAGDVDSVAKALKQANYYTAGEADYARGMKGAKAAIDRALGAP